MKFIALYYNGWHTAIYEVEADTVGEVLRDLEDMNVAAPDIYCITHEPYHLWYWSDEEEVLKELKS